MSPAQRLAQRLTLRLDEPRPVRVLAKPAWSRCSAGHPHVGDRPTVQAVVVDVAARALLVAAGRWRVPTAVVPTAHRTPTVAVRLATVTLDASPFDLTVAATSREEACECNGLRIHTLFLEEPDLRPRELNHDGEPAHRWVDRNEVLDLAGAGHLEIPGVTLQVLRSALQAGGL